MAWDERFPIVRNIVGVVILVLVSITFFQFYQFSQCQLEVNNYNDRSIAIVREAFNNERKANKRLIQETLLDQNGPPEDDIQAYKNWDDATNKAQQASLENPIILRDCSQAIWELEDFT